MYIEVYDDNVVFIICHYGFFVAWLSECAALETDRDHWRQTEIIGDRPRSLETDRDHASTSPHLGRCII